jgi:hypothetical protein
MFSSTRSSRRVPGIRTIHGCCARSHPRATWPGVAPLGIGEPADVLDECEVRCQVALGELRDRRADVAGHERGAGICGAGEEALAERAEGDEADAGRGRRRQHVRLRVTGPERVLALHGSYRANGVRAADRRSPGLIQAEVVNLASLDELIDRASAVLDRDGRPGAGRRERSCRCAACAACAGMRRRPGGSAPAGCRDLPTCPPGCPSRTLLR